MSRPVGEIKVASDLEELSQLAAEEFVRLAQKAMGERGRFSVVLSGGKTPRTLYEILARAPLRDRVEWQCVDFFWGDERAVASEDEESNFRMANETLITKVAVNPERVHRMPADEPDLDSAAKNYQNAIARVFNVDPAGEPPSMDLVLLGLGPDGHTASLFPYTKAIDETERWVVPNYVPRLRANRMTMTARIINRAAEVMFLVAGEGKAVALAQVLEGPYDPKRLPAQKIRPETGRLLWLIDRKAAGELKSRTQSS